MQGSRAGMPMATAWAVMQHLGVNGYRRLTERTIATHRKIVDAVRATPGLRVLGEPDAHLLAIGSDGTDVFAVGDALAAKGWYLDRQGPPDSLHATVSAGNAPVVDEFITDVQAAAAAGATTKDRSTRYSDL
jgi:glutamate/tyrosine decarboxylase-like PLP-dependent enzyme